MICQECQKLLWDDIEGSTTKEQKQQIQEHLRTCHACQQEKKILSQMHDILHTMPQEDLPEGYHTRLMAKINAEAQKNTNIHPFTRKQQKTWRNIGVVAATLLMVAALGGIQGLQTLREPQQNMIAQVTEQSKSDGAKAVPDPAIFAQMQNETAQQQTDTQDMTEQEAIHQDTQKKTDIKEEPYKQNVQNQKIIKSADISDSLQNAASKSSKTGTQPQASAGASAEHTAQGEAEQQGQDSEMANRMQSEETVAEDQALNAVGVRAVEESTQEWLVEVESISDAMQQIRTEIKNQSWVELGTTETSITIELQACQVQALYDVVESIGKSTETIAIEETTSQAQTQVCILFQAI